MHSVVPCTKVEQGTQFLPHDCAESFRLHTPLHMWKPLEQPLPQLVPSHSVVPPVPVTGQGVHRSPQLAGSLLSTHLPSHLWNPSLHSMPQVTPSQVGVPFALEQGMHEVPHASVLVLGMHLL